MTSWLIGKLKWIVGLFLGVSIAVAAPTAAVEMKWVTSYETIGFNTIDGDLELNEYAYKGFDDEDGDEWYIRVEPKNKDNFTKTNNPRDIVGKREVTIRGQKSRTNLDCIGCAYYSEFINRGGEIIRIPFEGRYQDLRDVKDAPQPVKIEFIAPIAGLIGEAAIEHDNSSAGTETSASSISWSHSVNSATNGIVWVAAVLSDEPSGSWSTTASTFNGTAMTRVTHEQLDAGANDVTSAQYIVATAGEGTGSKTVYIEASDVNDMDGAAETYTGVDQTTPYDGGVSLSQDGSGACTTSVTSAVNDLVVGFCSYENTTTLTGNGSQVDRQVDLTWQADHQLTTSELAGAASVTFAFTDDVSGTNAHVLHAANLNVAAGAPPAAAPPPIPQAIIIQ